MNIFEKANRIIGAANTVCIGVIDGEGFPSVSTVVIIRDEESPGNIFEAYFSTGISTNKAKCLTRNGRASICCHSGNDNVTLIGEAKVLGDEATKKRFWRDILVKHFPLGESDPNYCVIKFTTKAVSLSIDGETARFEINELLKVQSRCGLLCDGCHFKKEQGCEGCIALQGKPFWGECPVALCAQSKNYEHCGECDIMPCELLRDFSCGESEHGDNPKGARIELCRAWKTHG